jgi:hypothetical protein
LGGTIGLQYRRGAGAGVETASGLGRGFLLCRSGNVAHCLPIEGVVNELYDVVALSRIARPMMIGFRAQDIRRTVSIEG